MLLNNIKQPKLSALFYHDQIISPLFLIFLCKILLKELDLFTQVINFVSSAPGFDLTGSLKLRTAWPQSHS